LIVLGIDAGNLFSKAVLLDEDCLLSSSISETTGNVCSCVDSIVSEVLEKSGVTREDVKLFAVTGGGSELIEGLYLREDDVLCIAAAGAYYLPDVEMVVDIGGQSITSILIDEDGDVVDFMRNDKCASGSGRFLEILSGAAGIPIKDLSNAVELAENPVKIRSQCGVFAESEVISYLNEGKKPADILWGLCDAVAGIVAAQARRFPGVKKYTITGGVARIDALTSRIENKLEKEYLKFPHDPMLGAALGAALIARLES